MSYRTSIQAYHRWDIAVYKGDEQVCFGNLLECAKAMNIRPETLYWYTMPTYQRRIARRKHSSGNVRQVVRI